MIITKPMADKLSKLPPEVVGGAIKHLTKYVYEGAPSDPRWRAFEKLVDNCKKASPEECERIIAYLNSRLKTKYKLTPKTREKIDARFAEGHTVEDFSVVIDTKAEEWLGTDYAKHLCPETLFGTKFEKYLNQQAVEPKKHASGFAEGSFDTDSFFEVARERAGSIDITDEDCPFLKQ